MATSREGMAGLGRQLVLDELFDLALYRALHERTSGDLCRMLGELIPIETRHAAFWQKFFGLDVARLDWGRRLKLRLLVLACRLFGEPAVHLVLEAIEIYGVRKYLFLWERYRHEPLGGAVKEILTDELGHEDQVVSAAIERRIDPARVRNFFLGFNDGLVEILGAVSGFFAAFRDVPSILIAGATVAVAGSFSMAAGAFAAASSENEVARVEEGKRAFLGTAGAVARQPASPLRSGLLVGCSYMLGALVPVLPVVLGATTIVASVVAGGLAALGVSAVLAFLSGMAVRRRLLINLGLLAAAVVITYAIGLATRRLWGIEVA
jgi:VIT1/CCC1 family predicted Fe2+/Mn2+ transporter